MQNGKRFAVDEKLKKVAQFVRKLINVPHFFTWHNKFYIFTTETDVTK